MVKKKQRLYPQLDYTIQDPQQRNKIVHQIVNSIPAEKFTPYYIEELTKYLTETEDTKKDKTILTDNRMVTIMKRETSYEGLMSKMENGEDGIYNFIIESDKNVLLTPKLSISAEDEQRIPELKKFRQALHEVEKRKDAATGKEKSLLTKQVIEMRKDQYVIKSAFKPQINTTKVSKSQSKIDLSDHITIDKNGEPVNSGPISFFDPVHVSKFLCNYSQLKSSCAGKISQDLYYIIEDFEKLVKKSLQDTPMLLDIVKYKIKEIPNKEIAELIQKTYGSTYSIEYISTLWRKKIPKIIAEHAKQDWIVWHYTFEEKGKWKKCSRCQQVKLAHPYFFTKNKTSKDGFYSLCKCCRNKKKEIK